MALGEATWRSDPMRIGELERLLRIMGLMKARGRPALGGTRLLLFSPAGFTKRLRERAKEGDTVVLVDLQRMYVGD